MFDDIHLASTQLFDRLLNEYDLRGGICSMSSSLYDTAWVSMVSKNVDETSTWLFPASFRYICDAQKENGGWEGSEAVDQIINSLACLLSLKRHNAESALTDRATHFLSAALSNWDISKTERVAFEIIIPNLLDLLAVEGIHFQFPSSDVLRQLHHEKMSKFDLSLLYNFPSTVLHSLESLISHPLQFNKISHHLNKGSMMASPSSTAAYLMCASKWDEDAEKYLHDALENGGRIAEGVVTSVFPITTFELAWVVTLISSLTLVNVQFS
jgi:hypothetical protein